MYEGRVLKTRLPIKLRYYTYLDDLDDVFLRDTFENLLLPPYSMSFKVGDSGGIMYYHPQHGQPPAIAFRWFKASRQGYP